MQIESSGILCSAKINSNKACYTFSSFVSLKNGSILATARGGNNKDSEFEGIEFFRSDDEGENWSESWEPFKNVEIDNLKGSLKLCYCGLIDLLFPEKYYLMLTLRVVFQ